MATQAVRLNVRKQTKPELEHEIRNFAKRVHAVVEKSRMKMTQEERQTADSKALRIVAKSRAKRQRTA